MSAAASVRFVAIAVAAISLAACATGGAEGEPDGSVFQRVDAAPSAPDADPNSPDSGPSCPTQPCDLHAQCGCGGGQACDVDFSDFSSGNTACREVEIAGDSTDTCEDADDCAAGHVCAGGYCRPYCEADAECPGPGGICLTQLVYDPDGDSSTDNSEPVREDAVMCTNHCDATNTDGCPSGFACHWVLRDADAEVPYYTQCTTPGSGSTGDACDGISDCGVGHTCVFFDEPQCRRACIVGNGSACTGDTSCTPFSDANVPKPRIGDREYGYCN